MTKKFSSGLQYPKYLHKVVRTTDDPSDELLFDREVSTCSLRCPVCGDPYTHVQAVYTLIGGDESDGLYRGSHLVARESGYRRDAIAVRVQGETCGHRWDVVFQQHKGQSLVRIDILEPVEAQPGLAARMERRY
ncbi:MAG: hypothetical protein ACJ71Q_17305 [Terriglobales bacterium]